MALKYGSDISGGRYTQQDRKRQDQRHDHVQDPTKQPTQPVTNDRRHEKTAFLAQVEEQEVGYGNYEHEYSYRLHPYRTHVPTSTRDMMILLLLVLGATFFAWKWCMQPQIQEEREVKEGFMRQENGTYAIAKNSHFDGVRMQTLDAKLIPGGVADPEGRRRLVFVGDIHGCAHELKKLLEKVDFDEQTDHLIAVGDTISKGPENVETLDLLMKLGANSVRGNHEDRILALAPSILKTSTSTIDESSKEGDAKDAKLLRQLTKEHLRYLKDMPLMLRIPALPMADAPSHKTKSSIAEEILVVHAGLVPAITLEKQDPYFVMNMRSIKTKTHKPLIEAAAKKTKSKPWHHLWAWYNDRLFRKKSLKDFEVWHDLGLDQDDSSSDSLWFASMGLKSKKKWPAPQVVVYGHHAKAGLQVDRWSKGLDTGCVRGGKLTAMVLDARGRQELFSVKCKDQRQ